MVLLPALVLGAQIESTRVLEVRRQDYGFVTSLAWQLDAKVPRIQSDEDEVEVLGCEVLVGKRIESRDGVSKGTRVSYVLPGERSEASCTWGNGNG